MNPRALERQFRGFPTDDPRIPKDDSAGSPHTICDFPHRLSRKSVMDYRGNLQISVTCDIYRIRNSRYFVEVRRDLGIKEDEVLVSFNVTSLFINVPVDEAVQVIRDSLQNDRSLSDRTTLSPDRVAELLEVCLQSTHFSHEGAFYKQREGAAMGSPVSAVVANLYMEFFKELALDTAPVKPRLWKRHIDDTSCIVKKGKAEGLLDQLNSV